MDLGTIVDLGAGVAFILMSILTSGGALGSFINIPSIFMVIGGSFAAMLVGNPMSRMLGIIKYLNIILRVPNYEEERIISSLVNFSEKAYLIARRGLTLVSSKLVLGNSVVSKTCLSALYSSLE